MRPLPETYAYAVYFIYNVAHKVNQRSATRGGVGDSGDRNPPQEKEAIRLPSRKTDKVQLLGLGKQDDDDSDEEPGLFKPPDLSKMNKNQKSFDMSQLPKVAGQADLPYDQLHLKL